MLPRGSSFLPEAYVALSTIPTSVEVPYEPRDDECELERLSENSNPTALLRIHVGTSFNAQATVHLRDTAWVRTLFGNGQFSNTRKPGTTYMGTIHQGEVTFVIS